MADPIIQAMENELTELSRGLTEPGERECLRCYILRMLAQFGCDNTLRWANQWQSLRAPRASALAKSLMRQGGYCDCEVILNVYPEPEEPLPCAGVSRAGSTQPCRTGQSP